MRCSIDIGLLLVPKEVTKLTLLASLILIMTMSSSLSASQIDRVGSGSADPVEKEISENLATARRSPTPNTLGATFGIRWQTINGGFTDAGGGDYQLRGTVGQVDADPAHPAQSEDFSHTGGFWAVLPAAVGVVRIEIFSDRFEQE